MTTIFLISIAGKSKGRWTEFHFRGFFKGFKIKCIYVCGGNFCFDQEYLLQVECITVKDEVLLCRCLRQKLIFNHLR